MDDFVQTLYCTTDIGAERPVHRCGNPMSKTKARGDKEYWSCVRYSCNDAQRRAAKKYEKSQKGKDRQRRYRESKLGREKSRRTRERMIRVGGLYLGLCGFTLEERKELLYGKTD